LGQIGDGTTVNRFLPTSINISSIYSKNLNIQFLKLSSLGNYHTCAYFISPFTCFLIEYNDSSVCSGNGKKLKKIIKI
jgi:hypothetical protein